MSQVAFDSSTIFGSSNSSSPFGALGTGQPPQGIYRAFGKRAIDILLVLLAIVPVSFLLAGLAAVIALDGRSPIYVQNRVGQDGRIFRIFKLRSMVRNADKVLAAYLAGNPRAKEEWDVNQKLRNDPRITRFGYLIRRTSLDELPQIFNVLRGDMSLVGPRPMMCDQRHLYPGQEYYAMRPGITGYWQTSVRNESSFSQRAFFDKAYFADLSFMTDLKVLLRTVGVVLRATGH